jgi:hypothetical protein
LEGIVSAELIDLTAGQEPMAIPVAKVRQFMLPYDGVPLDFFEGILREKGFFLMDFEPVDEAAQFLIYVATYGPFMEVVARYQEAMMEAANRYTGVLVAKSGVTVH